MCVCSETVVFVIQSVALGSPPPFPSASSILVSSFPPRVVVQLWSLTPPSVPSSSPTLALCYPWQMTKDKLAGSSSCVPVRENSCLISTYLALLLSIHFPERLIFIQVIPFLILTRGKVESLKSMHGVENQMKYVIVDPGLRCSFFNFFMKVAEIWVIDCPEQLPKV